MPQCTNEIYSVLHLNGRADVCVLGASAINDCSLSGLSGCSVPANQVHRVEVSFFDFMFILVPAGRVCICVCVFANFRLTILMTANLSFCLETQHIGQVFFPLLFAGNTYTSIYTFTHAHM